MNGKSSSNCDTSKNIHRRLAVLASSKTLIAKATRRVIRRVERLWSSWVLKILDVKFPTVFSRLNAQERATIKELLKPGDVLLEDNNSYPLSQIGARMIGSSWSHSGVYVGNDIVIDSGSRPYVAEVPLDNFLDTSDLAIYSPLYTSDEDRDSALRFIRGCVGRPFNRTFNLSHTDSFYCTQLIYEALKQMPNPILIAINSVLGRPVILASAVETTPAIKRLWVSRKGFWLGFVSHVPSYFVASLGLAAGNFIAPQLALPGAALSLIVSLWIENRNLDYGDPSIAKAHKKRCCGAFISSSRIHKTG